MAETFFDGVRPMQEAIDEALKALRSGRPQEAVFILDRHSTEGGSAAAQTAWTRAGRPECGRLL